ncbi:hypothetical protein FE848_12615 [Marinobacter sp. 1-3A]|uniref:DUF7673 family protein n=1 Tax=Marinobacter sp. 1-3A TaxID=2582920 RepID=UPI001904B27D|nr:hypothetical protein [Marinobacter sp. 1-3A]MBK1874069.1 hypothetical protein [Marinobacter sp. 1-3A]
MDRQMVLPDCFLASLEEQEKLRQQREQLGLPALRVLVDAAHSGGGQGRHIRRFLLGLYNASRWPFELDRLRALDTELQQAALRVLALDWNGREVHTYLPDGDALFQSWWERESEA